MADRRLWLVDEDLERLLGARYSGGNSDYLDLAVAETEAF